MKFGFRVPSLAKRISARTSWKRYARHSLGFKAPRGMGALTSPKKFLYNKIYNKTSFGLESLLTRSIHKSKSTTTGDNNLWIGCGVLIGIILLITNPIVGLLGFLTRGIIQYYKKQSPEYKLRQNLKQAKVLIDQENYQGVIDILYDDIKNNSGDLEVNAFIGTAYYGMDDYKNAVEPFEYFISQSPNSFIIKLRLSNSYYNLTQYDKAIGHLQTIPEYFEQYIKVIGLLGLCFHKKGHTDMAIEIYKKAPLQKRKLNDDLVELHYNLGILYKEIGDKKHAIKHIKKVYSHDISYRDVAMLLPILDNM